MCSLLFYIATRQRPASIVKTKPSVRQRRGLLLPPSPPAQTPTLLPPPSRPHFSRRSSRRRCLPLSGKAAAPRTLRGGEGDLQPNFASRPSRWRPLGVGRVPRGAHPLGVVVTGRWPTCDAVPTHWVVGRVVIRSLLDQTFSSALSVVRLTPTSFPLPPGRIIINNYYHYSSFGACSPQAMAQLYTKSRAPSPPTFFRLFWFSVAGW